MKSVTDRLLSYVAVDTRSDDASGRAPSTPGQLTLARMLAEELQGLGLKRVRVTEFGCVFGELPASPECAGAPALGLIAHLDTSPDAAGRDVRPRIVVNDGGPIALGDSGRILDPERFPRLRELVGQQLVVTDGRTLLGADDKAGIAEIVTALERVADDGAPHGKLCVAFTPDEEIGRGTRHFDLGEFGADAAYTLDGSAAGTLEFQNFNAAEATFEIRGVSVHTGTARGIMRNAQRVAFELHAMLPPEETPECTENFEGFYHLTQSRGTVGAASLTYLIRDHDAAGFEARKQYLRTLAARLNDRCGAGTVALTIRDQYRNMEEFVRRRPEVITLADAAIRQAGLEPRIVPIRGGTDGALLSARGLPCPNLGTGGYNFHGEYEFASVREMEQTVEVIRRLIAVWAGQTAAAGDSADR